MRPTIHHSSCSHVVGKVRLVALPRTEAPVTMAGSTIINHNLSQWPSDMFWLNMSFLVKITWAKTA